MIISSKCISDAIPSEGEAGHVLILTPLYVFVKVQFLTLIPIPSKASNTYAMAWSTSNPSYGDFFVSIANGNTVIPVPMCASVMLIPVERPIWIPYVFMLSLGAMTLKCWNVTLWHLKMLM
ncbi:hypothetical protein FF1_012876 [Malus domestica]